GTVFAPYLLERHRQRFASTILADCPDDPEPDRFEHDLSLWFERLGGELGCTRGSVVLYDLERGDYSVCVGLQEPAHQPRSRYQSRQGCTGWVIANAEPLLVPDADPRNLARWGLPPLDSPDLLTWAPETERTSFLGVPITSGAEV